MPFRHLLPRAAGAALVVALAVGCTAADGPPAITLDRTACAHCGMLVSELRTVAALRASDGTSRVFDDIGCLIDTIRDLPSPPDRVWVHDAGGTEWLEAAEAVFTRGRDVWTPMGSGVLAWRQGASPFDAVTMSFEELLRDAEARGQMR